MPTQYKGISLALIIAALSYALAAMVVPPMQAKLLGVVMLLVTLWTNGALPLGVVSLLPIVLFPALGLLNTSQTSGNYANGIIFLFLGGFMVAIAVEKTDLHKIIARRLLTIFPATPRGAIFALAITSAALSSVLSNTTTALLLLPLAHFLASDLKLKMRLALAIAFGASAGGIVTPIGTPPNLILYGFLQSHEIAQPSFAHWVAMMSPFVAVMIGALGVILSIGTGKMELAYKISDFTPITSAQKRLGTLLITLAILLCANSPFEPYYSGLGLDERSLILFYGLLMFMPKIGFLEWSESKKIPYEIIFLFGAGFALAQAFSQSGLDQQIAEAINMLLGLNIWLMMAAVIALICVLGLLVSNTALASITLPIVYSLSQNGSLETNLFLFAATVAASFSFILPISTPPNAIAFSSGAVKVSDMAKYGVIFTVIAAMLLIATAALWWRLF